MATFAHTQKIPLLLRDVHIGDELCRFGVGVVEESFAKLCNLVVTTLFGSKWLMDESVLGEFVPQSPRNLSSRGSDVVTMHLAQTKPNSLRGDNNARLVQQIKDVSIGPRHPRDWWGHLT
ncbi:hypothetical protein [Halococcus salifodinae]|uniref:hypothetical protein n=1 Tax=Halococcus salifodinae TaxID=36738 RepID=UPI0013754490|nr:hypothetical protein [Halococcus salifodinae]